MLLGPLPALLCKTSIDQLLRNGVEHLLLSFCGRLIRFFIVENQDSRKSRQCMEYESSVVVPDNFPVTDTETNKCHENNYGSDA